MSNNQISILIRKIDSFPALPTVATRVMEIIGNPQSSARDLFEVINLDESLTMAILKRANSPYFGFSREVSSLQHAIALLGMTEIRDVVLAKALFDSFKLLESEGPFDITCHWKHSILCGLATRVISANLACNADDLFVAGLIHDVGKLIIYMTLPTEFFRIIDATGTSGFNTSQAEKDILGITHDELGMALLRKWMFPERLMMAVRFHHRPFEGAREPLFPLIVCLSDLLAWLTEGPETETYNTELKAQLFSPELAGLSKSCGLNLTEGTVGKFQTELTMQREEITEILSLFLG